MPLCRRNLRAHCHGSFIRRDAQMPSARGAQSKVVIFLFHARPQASALGPPFWQRTHAPARSPSRKARRSSMIFSMRSIFSIATWYGLFLPLHFSQ